MMRVIATGKGGVGKTTLVSTLCTLLARDGYKVLVFDTDPSMNLAMTLGIPFADIATLAEDKVKIGTKIEDHDIDIDVDSIIEEHSAVTTDNVRVVLMGTIPSGGAGCLCSSISLVKVLVESFVLRPWEYDFIIVDSQAGPEILGRGLATRFECNLVVTEAMPKAMEVTRQVINLSKDLDIRKTILVLNKYVGEADLNRVSSELRIGPQSILTIRDDDAVREADRLSIPILSIEPCPEAVVDIMRIKEELLGKGS
ncbi:MAG: protochlorophyllide reductase iron-sulfur ATP-binding protein [Methanomassiliicoccales archaeon PtaU1.Bin030]|nr:MAG: protochlorophyllide reductase iron-sulfur ATP-binding protein [Methanomassiliicoccales archaeon PtaU1.Bin030]